MTTFAGKALRVALVYDDTLDRHGGIAQYCLTLAAGLQRRGHHVTFLVGESSPEARGEAPVHSLARNVGVRFNGNRLSVPLWSRRRRVNEVVDAGRFDILHVQVPYSPLMAGRVIASADPRTAVIGTCHVFSERRIPRAGALVLGALARPTLRRFDEFIGVSEPAAVFARALLGVSTGEIVPNMVDIEALRSGPAARNQAGPSVVFVGSLVPRKGVAGLISAFAAVADRHPTASLTIAGSGPLRRRLERQARDLRLEARTRFLGTVSEAEKGMLLRGADVTCFPARFGESFGVVLLEAMAADSAVVLGGANPGHRTVLGREDVCVDADDPVGFAAKLDEVLGDAGWRQRIRDDQRRRVAAYDAERVCERLLAVYRRTLAVLRSPEGQRATSVEAALPYA